MEQDEKTNIRWQPMRPPTWVDQTGELEAVQSNTALHDDLSMVSAAAAAGRQAIRKIREGLSKRLHSVRLTAESTYHDLNHHPGHHE